METVVKFKFDKQIELNIDSDHIGAAGKLIEDIVKNRTQPEALLEALTVLLVIRRLEKEKPGTLQLILSKMESDKVSAEPVARSIGARPGE
jgi:hypothetical protein